MFKKILIANRGEIATRIVHACRSMGILSVVLYESEDISSLHVRLADECVLLDAPDGFLNMEAIIRIARQVNADAIHPGYGFLAEEPEFAQACAAAGLVFIGPSADTMEQVRSKINALYVVAAAGFTTVEYSEFSYGHDELSDIPQAAAKMGFPLVIKSCRGGRGLGERWVDSAEKLETVVRNAQAQSLDRYGDQRVYLEKGILPAHQVGVQILGDKHGNLIHLGEREGSIISRGNKIVEESPAPCLSDEQRQSLHAEALEIARLFNYENAGTVEFIVDADGNFHFTEIKSRIQVEHPLTEMRSGVDLIREQIRIAAGEPLAISQDTITLRGHAIMCRVLARDPWAEFMAAPGELTRVRFPCGAQVRVDTYVYCNAEIPLIYEPLIGKLTAWDRDRTSCIGRMETTLQDTKLIGIQTNIAYLQRILESAEFCDGTYSTDLDVQPFGDRRQPIEHYRDLAIIAATLYVKRNQAHTKNEMSTQRNGGWKQSARRMAMRGE
ncbi:MAG: ATP-grasp domain-containing protein [Anaerolineae bacterium]|nr:ATP-grasp domain-containing protein [Anaerolineae bacterium]MCO5194972.1 ATP-grasp domain-containing protein [Anaerolineae bacterium]